MIKLSALSILATLSFSALGQTCYVDMMNRYNQVIRSFTAFDATEHCKEAMKQCRFALRTQPSLGGVDCIRDEAQRPVPSPSPYPSPRPRPMPRPEQGYPQYISIGEEVYHLPNNQFVEVIGQDIQGRYVVKSKTFGSISTGWSREQLAPLRGCAQDICVNDRVYNTTLNRVDIVVAIQAAEKFVAKSELSGFIAKNLGRNELAAMEGCDYEFCAGDTVYDVEYNRFASIVGFQTNGKYVIKSENFHFLEDGKDRNSLAITQGCQLEICVGARVIEVRTNRVSRVIALQTGNRFVIKDETFSFTNKNLTISDIVQIR